MSKLLEDLIQQQRDDTDSYAQFLKSAEALAKHLGGKGADNDRLPIALRGNKEAAVLYSNLPDVLAAVTENNMVAKQPAAYGDDCLYRALSLDKAIRDKAPSNWKGGPGTRGTSAECHLPDHEQQQGRDLGHLRDHQEPASILMRNEEIVLGTLRISLVRKRMKNVHLTVHPPEGRVTLVAPTNTRAEVARAYAISKLAWIRQQQTALNAQARETPRQFRERESHELWGRRQLMTVREADVKPFVKHDHRCITLTVRPGHDLAKRAQVMHECTRRCCMA
jgi:hypothetical protein